MSQIQTNVVKLGLSALHYSGAARALAPATRGLGAVFMLHHVSPEPPKAFSPNRILQITPDFLEATVQEVRRSGFDIVSLDEAHARITTPQFRARPFACFTFDDGYRDNRDHAYPVLKRHDVPFTVYVASDFAGGRGFLWWLVLEQVIAVSTQVAVASDGDVTSLRCRTDAEKTSAFNHLYWRLRSGSEAEARAKIARMAAQCGIDIHAPCRSLAMTWSEIAEFARDPLVTIGAHSVSHHALAKLSAVEAQAEISDSIRDVETRLSRPCHHFCYPYGNTASASDREFATVARLGLKTGVTTSKGVISAHHASTMTALPRVSLNGDFQRLRYLKPLLSGLPFTLLDGLRRPARDQSGLCIQRTSHAAGTTQASPPTM